MKAKTDQGPTESNSPKPDYIQGLFTLLGLVSSQEVLTKFENDFNQCHIRYGDMKKQLAKDMIHFIKPIRDKAKALENDPDQIDRILAKGALKARKSAESTLTEVRKALGFRHL